MKLRAFAVIDTNVLISSCLPNRKNSTYQTPPREILKFIKSNNITPLFDERMLNEYYDVLNYGKFSLDNQLVYDMLYTVVNNGIMVNDITQTKEYFKDKDDIPFYEVTMSSEEFDSYLVTGNDKHFPNKSFVKTPQDVLQSMERFDNLITNDTEYDKVLDDLIKTQTSTDKYTSGKDLIDDIFDTKNKTINPSAKVWSDRVKMNNYAFAGLNENINKAAEDAKNPKTKSNPRDDD